MLLINTYKLHKRAPETTTDEAVLQCGQIVPVPTELDSNSVFVVFKLGETKINVQAYMRGGKPLKCALTCNPMYF